MPENSKWETKSGVYLSLQDLSEDHIHNVMRYLERTGKKKSPRHALMRLELFVRAHQQKYPEIRELVELLKDFSTAQSFDESVEEDYYDCIQEF